MRIAPSSIVKIGFMTGLIVLAGVVAARGETVGSTFATGYGTGGLELKIDNKTFYNGELQPKLSWELKHLKPWYDHFFKFKDIKPGDTGTTTISIHIKKNPAWVCLDFQNLKDKENGQNEPEEQEDATNSGELSKEIEFFAWHDDGDNTFEIGEKPLFGTSVQSANEVLKGHSYALSDSKNGPAYLPNQTKYVGINWCAGDLKVDVVNAKVSCDANAMGNDAQGDSMTLDVSLRAVSSKQQPKFTCVKEKWPGGGHGGWPKDDDDDNHHDDDYNDHWSKKKWSYYFSFNLWFWNKWNDKKHT